VAREILIGQGKGYPTVLTYLYLVIVAYFLGLTVWILYREKSVTLQLTAVLVIIPLSLRLLGIK
jgi:hypothetical protein